MKIQQTMLNQINSLKQETAELKKMLAYYDDILVKFDSSTKFLKNYLNFCLEENKDLDEVVKIVKKLKLLTKTNEFDFVRDMKKYLEKNVDKKNWIKFASLYNSCSKILKEKNLVDTYDSYVSYSNIVVEYEEALYESYNQIKIVEALIKKKEKELKRLQNNYNNFVKKNKKEKEMTF